MVQVLGKFSTSFSPLVNEFFSLGFLSKLPVIITFNNVSESVDGLQIRVYPANLN